MTRRQFDVDFEKKSSLGKRTKFKSTTSGGARGGAGTCDARCMLRRVLDSAFMQARVRLSCSDGLVYTGRHTFRRHASPPRAPGNFSTVQGKIFFQKSSGQILSWGPLLRQECPTINKVQGVDLDGRG